MGRWNSLGWSGPASLPDTRPEQQSGGKKDDAAHEGENAIDRDTHDPEGNEEDPDKRIEDQRRQSQWPAQHEQDAPEEELHHASRDDRQVPEVRFFRKDAFNAHRFTVPHCQHAWNCPSRSSPQCGQVQGGVSAASLVEAPLR